MPLNADQAIARGLRAMLEHFSALDPKGPASKPMAIQEAVAFLLVVEKPNLTVNTYANLAGMSPTSMSRYLLDWGERFRTGERGRGMIVGKPNVLDRREIQYELTAAGEAFMAKLMKGPLP